MTSLIALAGLAIPAVLGGIAAYRAPERRLARLDTESQILSRLEPGSVAATAIHTVVDEHASHLLEDLHKRRNLRAALAYFAVYFVLALAGLITIDRSPHLPGDLGGAALIGAAVTCLGAGLREGEKRPRNRDGSPRR